MAFEKYIRKTAWSDDTETPEVALSKDGAIRFNRAAQLKYELPERVELFYDRDNNMIGFKAGDGWSSVLLSKTGGKGHTFQYTSRGFARHVGWYGKPIRRYPLEWSDEHGMFVVDISEARDV